MAIKKLQNNFTTPEQSQRLLELGIPASSADCYYLDLGLGEYSDKPYWGFNADEFPCWSVGRLIEIGNICSIPKIKEAGFHLLAQDFDDLIETMIISMKMKVEHGWIDFSKLEE